MNNHILICLVVTLVSIVVGIVLQKKSDDNGSQKKQLAAICYFIAIVSLVVGLFAV